jgi:hypothetical protein
MKPFPRPKEKLLAEEKAHRPDFAAVCQRICSCEAAQLCNNLEEVEHRRRLTLQSAACRKKKKKNQLADLYTA